MSFNIKVLPLVVLTLFSADVVLAQTNEQSNLTISRIRAVGDYTGDVYDNTVELWFTTPLSWPAQSPCTNTSRVYIDKKHQQIVSAAYMAMLAGKKVNINVDPNLPNRMGSCEISFLDVVN
jgi:hypothetical protein